VIPRIFFFYVSVSNSAKSIDNQIMTCALSIDDRALKLLAVAGNDIIVSLMRKSYRCTTTDNLRATASTDFKAVLSGPKFPSTASRRSVNR
jgi:hypothetical protein